MGLLDAFAAIARPASLAARLPGLLAGAGQGGPQPAQPPVRPLGRSGPPVAADPVQAPQPIGRSPAGIGPGPGLVPLGQSGGFPASLIQSESGGNWNALNRYGYGGRLQFGQARLADAARAGIIPAGMSGAQFSRLPPEAQMRVEQWHFADIDRQAERMGLTRYIGQSVGGIPITQDGIRAMAHLGGIQGARRFLETGGRHNPADANGTRLSDYARMHGGASGSRQNASGGGGMGLLGDRMSTSGTGLLGQPAPSPLSPFPQEERRPSIWDRLEGRPIVGALADPDRRARLAIALEGMTLNPNRALMQRLSDEIDNRREDTRAARVAGWLAENGATDLAAAVGAGMDPQQAIGALIQQRQPRDPIITDGGLVLDPYTYQPIADYRQGGVDPTSGMQNYEYLTGVLGMDPQEAADRAFGSLPQGAQGERPRIVTGPDGLPYYEGGEPVLPGVAAPPVAPSLDDVISLERAYRGDPRVTEFAEQSAAYGRLQSIAQDASGASDVALIFNYMKMLDPGSVVREGEFATAEQTAGVPAQVLNLYNKVVSGERLTPEQRAEFVNVAERIYRDAEARYAPIYDHYSGLAGRHGVPVGDAIIDYRFAPAAAPPAPPPPGPPAPPPMVPGDPAGSGPIVTPAPAPAADQSGYAWPAPAAIAGMGALDIQAMLEAGRTSGASLPPEVREAVMARLAALNGPGAL
jgi:hypothetical protein